VALLVLNLFKDSAEYNLDTLLSQIEAKPVTGAAFSIARFKIKLNFFLGLNKIVSTHIESCTPRTWKSFRLFAGDGTTVGLPASPKVKKHFGFFDITDGSKYTCLANACMLYDVLSGLVLYTVIAPCSFGEGTLMVTTPEWLLVQVAEFAG